jgi:hypothetical protein
LSRFLGYFPVIKVFITEIYSFKGHGYNPLRISISGLAYISVPFLLTGLEWAFYP